MKIKTAVTIEHKSSTAVDLPRFGMDHEMMLMPGASTCSTIGSSCSCSSGMVPVKA